MKIYSLALVLCAVFTACMILASLNVMNRGFQHQLKAFDCDAPISGHMDRRDIVEIMGQCRTPAKKMT